MGARFGTFNWAWVSEAVAKVAVRGRVCEYKLGLGAGCEVLHAAIVGTA